MSPALAFWLEHVAGGEQGKTFDRFCEDLGLVDQPEERRASKTSKAESAIARAEQIREATRKAGGGTSGSV